jgi:ketosteroid isomerase-like protein
LIETQHARGPLHAEGALRQTAFLGDSRAGVTARLAEGRAPCSVLHLNQQSDMCASERLELGRRYWAALGEPITLEHVRGQWLEHFLDDFFSADSVFDLSRVDAWPEERLYEGHAGIRRFWEKWFEIFEEVSFECEHLEEVNGLVVSVARQRGTGITSKTPVEWRLAYLVTMADSKIVQADFYPDPDEALLIAGAVQDSR